MPKKTQKITMIRSEFDPERAEYLVLAEEKSTGNFLLGYGLTNENVEDPPSGVWTFFDRDEAVDEFEAKLY